MGDEVRIRLLLERDQLDRDVDEIQEKKIRPLQERLSEIGRRIRKRQDEVAAIERLQGRFYHHILKHVGRFAVGQAVAEGTSEAAGFSFAGRLATSTLVTTATAGPAMAIVSALTQSVGKLFELAKELGEQLKEWRERTRKLEEKIRKETIEDRFRQIRAEVAELRAGVERAEGVDRRAKELAYQTAQYLR